MANPISVHPVAGDADHDTWSVEFTYRVQVLDAATGEPVTDAYATSPTVPADVLRKRGVHPLRVLNTRDVTFRNSSMTDFNFGVRDLKTFVPAADSTESSRLRCSST